MKKIQILTITGMIILIGVVGFTIGRKTAPVIIEKETTNVCEVSIEEYQEALRLGTSEPQSLAGMITESCQCPPTEIIQEMGCIKGQWIPGVDEVRIKGEMPILKENTITKEFEEVKTVIDFNLLTK